MRLLTLEIRAALLINGRNRGADHVPVVKFFNPLGEGVFGLADVGYPELGFRGIASLRLPRGMGIERDLLFAGLLPISVWAQTAREIGSIRAAERMVRAAARARREEK
ncbi:hypothetical protein FHX14_005480 [Rhizobium sp. BK619]|uniref:DUF2958 domain-containing protein n=1 Tax=Rhizobium sp. BK619 TaxID=2586989 RepID=UPI00161CFD5F|nr:DUF2958 domain-containing protein [Rhizobium sp. BK619]MBB3649246.1 hypothetical protein [Rhizobium sp. BK619]